MVILVAKETFKFFKGCGFGCQIHHAAYCLIVAYASERTLIMASKGWRYHKNGWEDIFLPLSDTCRSPVGSSRVGWPGIVFYYKNNFCI